MEFSNREIATFIWVAVFVAGSFLSGKTRGAALGVLQAFFLPALLGVLALASLYVAGCVALLEWADIWRSENLKTTLLWAVTTAFVSMFDINRIDEDKTYFRHSVRDTLSAAAVVTFVAELYSFSLTVELLLIPLVAFLALIKAAAESRTELGCFVSGVDFLIGLLALGYLGNSIYQTAVLLPELAPLDLLREFGVPILLTLMLLPLLYVLSVVTVYERAFDGLEWAIKDKGVQRFAKRHAMLRFGLNLELLKRWRRQVLNLERLDRDLIRQTTREVKRARKNEKGPPPIDHALGWSPYSAQIFLRDDGFVTNDYHRSFETWWAQSPMTEVGDDIFPDNVAYYIEGDEGAVKQVRLKLNVNNPSGSHTAELQFYELSRRLLAIAISDEARDQLGPMIETRDTLDEIVGRSRVRLEREAFTGIKGGYSRRLIIDHSAASDWTPA